MIGVTWFDTRIDNLITFDEDRIEIDVREWRDGGWFTKERNQELTARA